MAQKNLRAFRHSVAELKRRGLLTGVDARSAKPTKRLKNLVKKFDDVLSGKATAVKLPPSEVTKYKKLDYEIASPKGLPRRVIIPHESTERVYVTGGKHVTIKRSTKGGGEVTKTNIPIEYHNLEQYLRDLEKLPSDPDSWYCMKVYGDYTHCYRTIDLLIEEFSRYQSTQTAMGGRPKDQLDFYQNLQIVKVKNPSQGEALREAAMQAKRKKHPARGHKAKYRARMAKLKAGPKWKLEQHREKNAERMRQYRLRHPGK